MYFHIPRQRLGIFMVYEYRISRVGGTYGVGDGIYFYAIEFCLVLDLYLLSSSTYFVSDGLGTNGILLT